MELDEIIYTALTDNEQLMDDTGGRIYSTCVEVPPVEDDNTPLPYIIIAEGASQNDLGTKDTMWESYMDVVNVSVIISGASPKAVKTLRRQVRAAVSSYVESMTEDIPYLRALTTDGIAWDWTKPCYYDSLHYQCEMEILPPTPSQGGGDQAEG
jgi:hypothetical protein